MNTTMAESLQLFPSSRDFLKDLNSLLSYIHHHLRHRLLAKFFGLLLFKKRIFSPHQQQPKSPSSANYPTFHHTAPPPQRTRSFFVIEAPEISLETTAFGDREREGGKLDREPEILYTRSNSFAFPYRKGGRCRRYCNFL